MSAVYDSLRRSDGHPVVVAPTGSGKSLLIAQIIKDAVTRWNGRALVVTHVRELVEQNADKIRRLCPHVPVGTYSAGLKRRDTSQPVICAGIQSIYGRACELDTFDLVLVDEAHLISGNDDSMYGRFLADAKTINPSLRLIGLTATPFRLDSGLIYGPGRIFDDVCYEISVRELIRDGYLSPLVTKAGTVKADTSRLHVRSGEFVAGEVEDLMDEEKLVEAACAEIVDRTRDRNSVLIFASGIRHGRHIQQIFEEKHGIECGFVCSETPTEERDELLARFRREPSDGLFQRKPLKYLANVAVLTTGFDSPAVDAIAILRPTMSPGLLVQMVGRGFRLHPGKRNCLVLDFGGNVERHGPVDQLRIEQRSGGGGGAAPAKECPECHSVIAVGYAVCPDCGYEFPPPERNRHEAQASEAGILSGEITDTEHVVRDVTYHVHMKKDAPPEAPKTMRVDYRLGLSYWQAEWICFEHTGYPRRKAETWWREHSPDPVPDTAEEAVALAESGALAVPERITVRSIAGEKFDRIVGYELGPVPEPRAAFQDLDSDDVPF